ncbi:EamA family transporter, partial [Bacillus tropicus]|nr:EamA family transporter [Bacillus tropicus]
GLGDCFILIGVFLANRTTIGDYFKQGKLLKKEL